MKDQRSAIKILEISLVLFVWLVLLITPVIFREENNRPILESVLKQFETLIPLTILIIVNRFFLVPKLLFKGRQNAFLFSVIGIILLTTVGIFYFDTNNMPPAPPAEQQGEPPRRPPLDNRDKDESKQNKPPKEKPGQSGPVPAYANFLILSVLIAGFDTGLQSTLRWTKVEQEKTELEKENVASQLALLKNQISPHFFMNTLNNIHSMIDINSEDAKMAIIKLSKLMRYLLYDTENQTTPLKKEIEVVESFINLMKLRFSEKVKITTNFPPFVPVKSIPPLLLIPLIENAFKHGVSYKEKSFINLDLIVGNDRLMFTVKNSKPEKLRLDEYAGVYLLNAHKRLELLYGKNYNFDIIESDDLFTVNLSIPL